MDRQDTQQQQVYFMNLDIIRFIAAYMIVIFHIFYGWQANWGNPKFLTHDNGQFTWLGKFIENAIHNMSFGVDIFFLISGFLITYLLIREKEQSGKIAIGKFYMRRVLRIWPLYFLTLACAPLLAWWVGEAQPKNYLPHLLFVGNFEIIYNGFSSAAVNHLWSICIEEHFYLFCPLIVAFVPNKKLPLAFWFIIFISFCFRGILVGTEKYWMNMYMNTLSRMDVLAIGCLSAWYFYHGKLNFNQSKTTLLIVSTFFMLLFVNDVYVYWDSFFLATTKKYTFVLVAGFIIGNLLFNENIMLLPEKKGLWHYFGKVSYGIYMFNPIAVALFVKLFHAKGLYDGITFFVGINLLLIVLVVVSFELYEKQFLKLKDKFAIVKTRNY